MICLDLQPYSIVNDVGFREFTRSLEPRYKLPTRQQLSSEIIPAMYEMSTDAISTSLSEASSLAITTDMWTSLFNDAYMSITGHYLTNDFAQKVWCLQVEYFENKHTANN